MICEINRLKLAGTIIVIVENIRKRKKKNCGKNAHLSIHQITFIFVASRFISDIFQDNRYFEEVKIKG